MATQNLIILPLNIYYNDDDNNYFLKELNLNFKVAFTIILSPNVPRNKSFHELN